MSLTYHELRMQNIDLEQTDNKNKLTAISQIKEVSDNIPPNLDAHSLIDKLKTEPDFHANLAQRLVRLFGLRNELVIYLEIDFIDFIDTQLKPLYVIQTGTYNFKEDKLQEFARCIVQLREMVDLKEKALIKKIHNQRMNRT